MKEGFEAGRNSAWSKNDLQNLFTEVDQYCKGILLYTMETEGPRKAREIFEEHKIFKYAIAYVFTHYNFGCLEDLGMGTEDIICYQKYISNVLQQTEGMLDKLHSKDVFKCSFFEDLIPRILMICEEIISVKNNINEI